jgi:hypothetical protein
MRVRWLRGTLSVMIMAAVASTSGGAVTHLPVPTCTGLITHPFPE